MLSACADFALGRRGGEWITFRHCDCNVLGAYGVLRVLAGMRTSIFNSIESANKVKLDFKVF